MRGGDRGGFRGRGRGGDRGGFRGRGRGGRGGRGDFFGPPATVIPLGEFTHSCEGFMVCKATHKDAPLINRPVYNEAKGKLGVVDEIFGPINSYGFTVKLDEGVKVESFKAGQKIFANPMHLKPVTFFQQRPKPPKGSRMMNEQGKRGPGIAKGPSSISKFGGGRGAPFRGGSSFRGAPRGGSFTRGRGGFSRGRGY